jgi:hypothetical protein
MGMTWERTTDKTQPSLIVVVGAAYFLPFIIAAMRGHLTTDQRAPFGPPFSFGRDQAAFFAKG